MAHRLHGKVYNTSQLTNVECRLTALHKESKGRISHKNNSSLRA